MKLLETTAARATLEVLHALMDLMSEDKTFCSALERGGIWETANVVRRLMPDDPWPIRRHPTCGMPTKKGSACRHKMGGGFPACSSHWADVHDYENIIRAWQDSVHWPWFRNPVAPDFTAMQQFFIPGTMTVGYVPRDISRVLRDLQAIEMETA